MGRFYHTILIVDLCRASLPGWAGSSGGQTRRPNVCGNRDQLRLLKVPINHLSTVNKRSGILLGLVEQQRILSLVFELLHAILRKIPLLGELGLLLDLVMPGIERYIFERVGGVLQSVLVSKSSCRVEGSANSWRTYLCLSNKLVD